MGINSQLEWGRICSHCCPLPIATGLPADTLQGHRDRFHEQFRRYPGLTQGTGVPPSLPASPSSRFSFLPPSSLKSFFKKASDMLYFKRLIQIPRLPEVRRGFSMRWFERVFRVHGGVPTARGPEDAAEGHASTLWQ